MAFDAFRRVAVQKLEQREEEKQQQRCTACLLRFLCLARLSVEHAQSPGLI
jgi:hypothetical protein